MYGGEMNSSRMWKIEIMLSPSIPLSLSPSLNCNGMDREVHKYFIPSQNSIDHKGDSKRFL